MGLLAELGHLSVGAWSPGGNGGGYIATGTFAGQFDPSFRESATLELLSVDIQRCKLIPTATLKSPGKFSSIDWGNPSRAHPAGLISGGLVNGTICVWDAATLIRASKPSDESHARVFLSSNEAKNQTASVRAVAFNPFVQHLLASGGADGQVLVWDLSNPSAGVSSRHPASKPGVASSPSKEDVTALTWNRKVHNILSTATSTGTMNVWDLKQSRQVISIRNPRGRLKCSSLAWHPEIATQIVITCDEDDSTGALLWDLRNATSPIMSYSHHSPKGVVSASWNSHDTDLLLTSSKDSRTVVVSVSSGEIVVDSPATADWDFDVKWSPRIPGLYLASSFEGRISVNSILSASSAPSVSSETANALAESFGQNAGDFRSGMADQSPRTTDSQRVIYNMNRPPKWLKPPSGLSFVFAGKRAYFSSRDGTNVIVDEISENIPSLGLGPEKLDKILMDLTAEDPSPALKWSQDQGKAAETSKETMAWDIMSMLLNTDSRRRLVGYLGFPVPPNDSGDNTAVPVYGLLRSPPIAVPIRSVPSSTHGLENGLGDDGSAIVISNGLDSLALDGPAPWDVSESFGDDERTKGSLLDGDDSGNSANGNTNVGTNINSSGEEVKETSEKAFSGKSSSEIDKMIKQAVIVGDFKTAVDACLHVDRTADALVIAHAGGPNLWLYTQSKYLCKADVSSGLKIIGAVAGPRNKLDEYIKETAEVGQDSWKEALAALLTFCPADELFEACSSLGNRLLHLKNDTGALACYLCAGNTGMVASTWILQSPLEGNSTSSMLVDRIKRLSTLVERIRIFTTAVLLSQGEHEIGAVRALDEVSGSILCEFGALLVAQGDYYAAITYLSNLDPTYSCGYGLAEDLARKASDCFALSDSSKFDSPYPEVNNSLSRGLTAHHSGSDLRTFSPNLQPSFTSGGTVYGHAHYESTPPLPPVSSAMQGPSDGTNNISPYSVPHSSVVPTSMTRPVINAPGFAPFDARSDPPSTALSASIPQSGSAVKGLDGARYARDPSSVYREAPLNPSQLPPPPVGVMSVSTSLRQGNNTSFVGSVVSDNGVYATQGTGVKSSATAMTQDMSTAPPPALPPPPSSGDGPPPSTYYTKAIKGQGANLPPSAEVAVRKLREARAPSSSGTPGGPRRSASSSSSLSSLVTETVYLDKIDASKIVGNELMIVKTLRSAFKQAQSRNHSGMYRKKMDDINKRLGKLVAGLNAGIVDKETVDKLVTLVNALEKSDFQAANSLLTSISKEKEYWEHNRHWIQGLKWLVECVLTGR